MKELLHKLSTLRAFLLEKRNLERYTGEAMWSIYLETDMSMGNVSYKNRIFEKEKNQQMTYLNMSC